MGKISRDSIANRFNRLDFHDDNLMLATLRPPRKEHDPATIEFEFEDDGTGARKLLSFHNCANLRFFMDFDVLAHNWFAQTEGLSSNTDMQKMLNLVTSQKAHWRTTFMPPAPANKPIRKKLMSIRKYRLFKLKFFGGTVEILARSFKLK